MRVNPAESSKSCKGRRPGIGSALPSAVAATLFVSLLASGIAAAQAQQPQHLQQQLAAIVARHHGDVALFAENLKTGETVGIHANEPVPTASVIKLAILYEAMQQLRSGKVHFSDPIVLRKSDQVQGSGVLLFFDTPLTLTFKDALSMMISLSDNTATNLVIDHLGLANIDHRIQEMGLKNTWLYKKVFEPPQGPVSPDEKEFGLGKTTPREMAQIMQKIVTCDLEPSGTPLTPNDRHICNLTLTMLRNQFYRNGIPRYLETTFPNADAAIANKTGELDAVRNDVGAIDSKNGLLILSIFTNHNRDQVWSVDDEGDITIAKIAKAIVQAWSPDGLLDFDTYRPQ